MPGSGTGLDYLVPTFGGMIEEQLSRSLSSDCVDGKLGTPVLLCSCAAACVSLLVSAYWVSGSQGLQGVVVFAIVVVLGFRWVGRWPSSGSRHAA